MGLRPLNWQRTNYHKFTRNGKSAFCETWKAFTPNRTYEVYQSVGGGYFFRFPGMTHNLSGSGFNSGADDILGKPKLRCKSIQDGQTICEQHWERIGTILLNDITGGEPAKPPKRIYVQERGQIISWED